MKLIKCAVISLLLVTATLGSFSQNCTCIPNDSLKIAVAIIQEARFMKLELKAKDDAIAELSKVIDDYNRAIQTYENKELASQELIAALKRTNAISEEQLKLKESVNNSYRKEVRKANTRTWVVGVAGLAAVVFTGWITTK